MENSISINRGTCRVCGLCGEVCPNEIIEGDNSNKIAFHQDRLPSCFKCGQCMAICPTKSIAVEGLSYSKDFFEITETASLANPFFDLIASRRSVRIFKDKPVPQEDLQKIVDAISLAPMGYPPHKVEVTVLQSREIIE